MEYPYLYLDGDNFVWDFKIPGDDTEKDDQIIFRPYIPTLHKKETKATIIEKLPASIRSNKAYRDAKPNEVVTVIDLNPQDDEEDQLCGENGWCKIRTEDQSKKYFLVSFLKFNENF